MVHKKIETENKIISYTQKGDGDILVFFHAGGLNRYMWNNQIETFGKDYLSIAYDIRGHGESTNSENNDLDIDDLYAILINEKIDKKITLVGCSLGSIIALDFALAYPEKIDKLVLVSPGLIGYQEKNEQYLNLVSTYVKSLQTNNEDKIIYHLKKMNAIGQQNRELEISINQYIDNSLKEFIKSGNHLRIPKIKEFEPLKRLGSLDAQTFIMYGELDFDYIKENAETLNNAIKNSEIVKIKSAGHLLNLENQNTFNKELDTFLNKK